MNKLRTRKTVAALGALAAIGCAAALAGQTQIWTQGEYADFERGVINNLSIRSDGLLSLAPHSHEMYDTGEAYLWALARDSKGNLYAAGGTGAKLFRIAADGTPKTVAEVDALEIHAIAIDKKDRVYFGTAPDGKVYRLSSSGKPEVFYDPKAKYIWAMDFDSTGNLLVATGGVPNGQGEIDRVTPDGKGSVFFKTDETHIRSMTIDAHNNLIVGTDPGGLVLRVSPAGEGFVLYQMPKKEVTAVAIAPNGDIYAAAVGSKQGGGPAIAIPQAGPAPSGATINVSVNGGVAAPIARPAVPPASMASGGVSGGSEVYRIQANGNPTRVWSNASDVVYAIAFDAQGHALLGAGNKGNLYRVESPTQYTALLSLPLGQITAFQKGPNGRLYAATGNTGKVFEIGPEVEQEGWIESDVFDSQMYTLWGRVSFEAHLNGGQVAIVTRSGNLDQPQKNWSAWSVPIASPKGGRVTSPAARFVQWKATLTADGAGHSPELESVDLAYLPKNVEPRVDEIEITPMNYRFPAPVLNLTAAPSGPAQSLNLPPLGRRSASISLPLPSSEGGTSTPAMQFAKGYVGARWVASDPNGDSLLYTVEIKGEQETEWKPLKEKLTDKYFSWDGTAFPDGDYRVRVTVTDAPSNPPAEALTGQLVSAPFTIDNTPPTISGLTASRAGGKLQVRWHAGDALSNLDRAEYSLDGGTWTVAEPTTKLSDSPALDYELTLDGAPGEHTVAVRVVDANENMSVDKVVIR
jgi:sugar lactone lactonase YvrE